jgi:hypothetical protein
VSDMTSEEPEIPDFIEWFQEWILNDRDRKPTPKVSGKIQGTRPHLSIVDEIHNEKAA